MKGGVIPLDIAGDLLDAAHYLGAARRGEAWFSDEGLIVTAKPTSRRLPLNWRELTRWCLIFRQQNDGSKQWGAFVRWFRTNYLSITTIVSYSDPSAGHDGALYRACNWLWAPTWHRLREPPTGNGAWQKDKKQSVKDRWVFLLKADPDREALLSVKDKSLVRRYPWASYTEPEWKRGKPKPGGGADYKRWRKRVL